jgi:hypothetical protein
VSWESRIKIGRNCYSLTTTKTRSKKELNVKIISKLAILSLVTASTVFAQSPQQVGTWSIYTSASNVTGKNVVMLQTTAVGQHQDARGNLLSAKLDIICKNDRVAAVAVETGSRINERSVSYKQAVPTTTVVFAVEGKSSLSENWEVADGGRTLSPYSQLFQAKLNRTWVERISGTPKVVLQLNQKEGESFFAPVFDTAELSEALSSVGCTK